MPVLNPKLRDQELAFKIAEYVLPSALICARILGYQIRKIVVASRTFVVSDDSTFQVATFSSLQTAHYALQRVAKTDPSGTYLATIYRNESPLWVRNGDRDGEFFVLAPVYSKRAREAFEKTKNRLPPGLPLAPGWPSMRKRHLSFYATAEELSASWGTSRPRPPRTVSPHRVRDLMDVNHLRMPLILCAFVYCDEEDRVLGFDDVSHIVAARMPLVPTLYKGSPTRLPPTLQGYFSEGVAGRLRAAEAWARTTDTAPEGATRVYYAETEFVSTLAKEMPSFREPNPVFTYKTQCVRRLEAEPFGAKHDAAWTDATEFAERLARYCKAVRSDPHPRAGEALPAHATTPVSCVRMGEAPAATAPARSSGAAPRRPV